MMMEHVDDFITMRFKSDISRRKHKDVLMKLWAFLQARQKDFITAGYIDIVNWLQQIDTANILVITKERYRRIAKQFFRHLKVRLHLRADIPVPELDEFRFTEKDRRGDVLKQPLTKEAALRILEFFRATAMDLYIGTRVLFETGMRVGELVHIKRADVDLETRRIYTTGKKGLVRYYVPPSFLSELKAWMKYQDQVNPDKEYLFPPLYDRGSKHANEAYFRNNLARAGGVLALECSTNPHAFRGLINDERARTYMLERDRDALLSILLCQVPASTNAKHYLMKMYDWKNPHTWEAHRALYDRLYPW